MTVERVRVVRSWEWARPERPARREVLAAVPEREEAKPPLLFVPGFGHGAWAFAELWLGHAAGLFNPVYALYPALFLWAASRRRRRRCARTPMT